MSSASGILRVLRYSAPFTVIACQFICSVTAACFVPPSRRITLDASQRALSKQFAAVICLLHLSEGLLHAVCAALEADWTVDPDAVVYTTLDFLIWLVNSIIQADAGRVYWLPNIATWTLALCLDIAVCLLYFQATTTGPFAFVQRSIGFFRIVSLVFLCASTISSSPTTLQNDFERQPLLHSSCEHGMVYSSHSGNPLVDDKTDEPPILTALEQEEHLDKVGGWWAYLREVKFLLPYIVPFGDRRRQMYTLAMLVLTVGVRIFTLFIPRILGNIVQAISNHHTDSTLSWQILMYVFAVKMPQDLILEPARKWLSVRIFYGCYLDLLLALTSHVAGLSFAFHENKQTGEIIDTIRQGEVLNKFVDDFVESTLPLMLDLVVAFFYLTYLFDMYVGLILATTYVFYGIVTYKGTILCAEARRKYRETSRVECNILHEAVANWMSTFYLNRQDYQHRRLDALSRRELAEQEYNYDLSLSMRECQTLVVTMGYLLILLRTAHLSTHAEDAVGNFVALIFYWGFFTTPLFKLAHFYSSLAQILVDVERLRQLMRTRPTVIDDEGAQDLVFVQGKVEYRNVSFSYDGRNTVIQNFDLTIAPGSTVAFVGQSGSGKTTTCDKLLFRAYDVCNGAILIDDQNIRSVTQRSLREVVGIVRQESLFNNDTVLENVRYARLDASDADVVAACKGAAIHDQIMRFPRGYSTVVGERGIKLSCGERQRLAIAQLFLRDPKIVVLDEATSSVDNVAESVIYESFTRICKGRTTIIIAHRLSTVQHADQIFVLDKGTIAERGTHSELLNLRGKYFQLWNKTQTAKRLKHDLERAESDKERELVGCSLDFSDNSDYDDCGEPPDMMQVDGASSSKQDHEHRGLRKMIHNLKEKFSSSKNRAEEDDLDDGDDEGVSSMRVLSPRIMEASPSPFSRRTSRRTSRRRPSRVKETGPESEPTSPTRARSWSISSPVSTVRMDAQESAVFNFVSSTQSRIPICVSPLATPAHSEQQTARDFLLQSTPQSPGRNAALSSHPILRAEDDDGPGVTYDTAGTSAESRMGGG